MNESFEKHAVLVNKVLSTLGDSGIKLKVNKCAFLEVRKFPWSCH